jgi:hypothetical protein
VAEALARKIATNPVQATPPKEKEGRAARLAAVTASLLFSVPTETVKEVQVIRTSYLPPAARTAAARAAAATLPVPVEEETAPAATPTKDKTLLSPGKITALSPAAKEKAPAKSPAGNPAVTGASIQHNQRSKLMLNVLSRQEFDMRELHVALSSPPATLPLPAPSPSLDGTTLNPSASPTFARVDSADPMSPTTRSRSPCYVRSAVRAWNDPVTLPPIVPSPVATPTHGRGNRPASVAQSPHASPLFPPIGSASRPTSAVRDPVAATTDAPIEVQMVEAPEGDVGAGDGDCRGDGVDALPPMQLMIDIGETAASSIKLDADPINMFVPSLHKLSNPGLGSPVSLTKLPPSVIKKHPLPATSSPAALRKSASVSGLTSPARQPALAHSRSQLLATTSPTLARGGLVKVSPTMARQAPAPASLPARDAHDEHEEEDEVGDLPSQFAGPGHTYHAPKASRFFVTTADALAVRVDPTARVGSVYATPLLAVEEKTPVKDEPVAAAAVVSDDPAVVALHKLKKELAGLSLAELTRRSQETTTAINNKMAAVNSAMGVAKGGGVPAPVAAPAVQLEKKEEKEENAFQERESSNVKDRMMALIKEYKANPVRCSCGETPNTASAVTIIYVPRVQNIIIYLFT